MKYINKTMTKQKYVNLEDERFGMFMTDKSFDLDIMYGRNFLKSDNIQWVILHRINLLETKTHGLYGQSKPADKSFMEPTKLSVMIAVEDGEQAYYGDYDGGITRDQGGNIEFGIYLKELEEKQTEINRGDIIEYNMTGENPRYYEVESANMVTDVTSKTIGGFAAYWRRVTAVPAKSDVVPFLKKYHD
jgi:hypothetical protein